MSKISCSRRFQFCCGHRVMNHESKCKHIHGHNYVLYVHARPKKGLDEIGRVIDFSEIKKILGEWIDTFWDHGFICHSDDSLVIDMMEDAYVGGASKQKLFYDAPLGNPTAENMANYLLNVICVELFEHTDIEIFKVVLWETENCFAEAVDDCKCK